MTQNDPLEGYRGRPERTPDEVMESQLAGLHSLEDEGIDPYLVREVLNADAVFKAIKGDTVMKRLVSYVCVRIDECTKVWQAAPNPNSRDALDAHREARAARLLLDWIQEQINRGATAEKQLEEEEATDHEPEN